jgi:hypothetical protein
MLALVGDTGRTSGPRTGQLSCISKPVAGLAECLRVRWRSCNIASVAVSPPQARQACTPDPRLIGRPLRRPGRCWQDEIVVQEQNVTTPRQAVNLLNVSPSTISRWRAKERLGTPAWSTSELCW